MKAAKKRAALYRMVMPEHTCPYGLKARHLLRSNGYEVEDNLLTTKEATDAFKIDHGVSTTPQTFINGQWIGGYDDLRRYFGYRIPGPDDTTYKPVVALFSVAFLIALAIEFLIGIPIVIGTLLPNFVAVAMVLLALQKLKDVESFATMFLNYDLLAKRWVPYSYVYPYVELAAGVLMLAHVLPAISIPAALFIGSIGAVSVIKAVYIDKRELKCACVGGDTKVPLGFVSLSENLMMIGMAVWMLAMYL
jgi:glutaredoxin